jgi:tetratricopeptide (TPR) repeat protein
VRLAYEKYEEAWRSSQTLASITEPITNLVSLELEPGQNEWIEQFLKNVDASIATGLIKPATIGSAYLATGDYKNASKYYQVAAVREPMNPNIYALRSLALQGEANAESIETEKVKLEEEASKLAETARTKGVDSGKIAFLVNELKANF